MGKIYAHSLLIEPIITAIKLIPNLTRVKNTPIKHVLKLI